MKRYRVHISEERCGDVIVRANTVIDAEELAVKQVPVEWCDFEVSATDVTEVDEKGNEVL